MSPPPPPPKRKGERRKKIVEEMKERDREERGTGMKGKKQKKWKLSPLPYLLQGQQALPNCKPISAGCPSGMRYMTPLHHPTTPSTLWMNTPSLVKIHWYSLRLSSGNDNKDGRTLREGRTYDRWIDRGTLGQPMWNHNTPPLSCGSVWKEKYQLRALWCFCVVVFFFWFFL